MINVYVLPIVVEVTLARLWRLQSGPAFSFMPCDAMPSQAMLRAGN